jgi:hypothetical protein
MDLQKLFIWGVALISLYIILGVLMPYIVWGLIGMLCWWWYLSTRNKR